MVSALLLGRPFRPRSPFLIAARASDQFLVDFLEPVVGLRYWFCLFALDDLALDRQQLDLPAPTVFDLRRGGECCETATRAQAVSSRLTALSGSWRAGT